jgi:hypothetical protein
LHSDPHPPRHPDGKQSKPKRLSYRFSPNYLQS